ncbi:alpha-hydroxy acid oxidase [Roseateles sp. DB2]|uniref:alpha-hydroxy acid oxidase n=1 Tax=Roseateles sp. DB2 TaxID=3453717 RepID=UPI003EEC0788
MSWRSPLLTSIPSHVVAAADYEPLARERLDEAAWAYLDGAAADEHTAAANRAAFARLSLQTRVLRDLRGGHTRCRLLGMDLPHPMLLAPVAHQGLFHPDAEAATALAAGVMQTPMIISTLSTLGVEAIAAQGVGPLWFQLYAQPHWEDSLRLVRRAEEAGCRALVLTVDAPVAGVRNREQRSGFRLPRALAPRDLQDCAPLPPGQAGMDPVFDRLMAVAPRWEHVEALRRATALPLLIKGLTHPEDARLGLEAGVDGLIVSNHGGRTLDGLPASLDLLPAIVQVVQGRVPVLMDGGIRRGSDVFKALSRGADAVLLGRCWVHALAAAGALGVAHVIRLLQEELAMTMALCGCRDLSDVHAMHGMPLP